MIISAIVPANYPVARGSTRWRPSVVCTIGDDGTRFRGRDRRLLQRLAFQQTRDLARKARRLADEQAFQGGGAIDQPQPDIAHGAQ